MPKYDLSILIPARNEIFVSNTVEDILKNKRGKTEVIVGLDGQWAEPGIKDHPDVRIVYTSKSLGQRGMTNQLARLSTAKYVAKCDAHVAFDEGFDVKLMEAMRGHDDWTITPALKNLHAFDWICDACGSRWYQGPTPKHCMIHEREGKNGSKVIENPNCVNITHFTKELVWKPNPQRPTSYSFCFDDTLHFQYFREFNKRSEGQHTITPSMSLQGSFFMLTRDKYWELNICDEKTGSWGQQGVEVACKTWLSGGTVMVRHDTWYAHMFRTQGEDFGFPYPNSGEAQEKAREYSRDTWFNNKFEKQIYPLSWLISKFDPVPGWSNQMLERVFNAGNIFYSTHLLANGTNPLSRSTGTLDNPSSSHAMSSTTDVSSGSGGVLGMSNKSDVAGVATFPVIADEMVKFQVSPNGQRVDEPSVNKSMNSVTLAISASVEESSVSGMIQPASPLPAASSMIDVNIGEKPINSLDVQGPDNEIFGHGSIVPKATAPGKGIIYYTDNQLPVKLAHSVQKQLKTAGLPITSASLKPMDNMGTNIHIQEERGYKAYFKQILAALEASTADIVFFCEHDVLYHQSHFEFTPPRRDKFYYNQNFWRVREDGFAVHWDANQVSGLVCYRSHALTYYRERIKDIDINGFNRSYEPGGRNPDLYEVWNSPFPNIDIRHKGTLTGDKWSPADFRDKSTCVNWQESTIDQIPGWDNLKAVTNQLYYK